MNNKGDERKVNASVQRAFESKTTTAGAEVAATKQHSGFRNLGLIFRIHFLDPEKSYNGYTVYVC